MGRVLSVHEDLSLNPRYPFLYLSAGVLGDRQVPGLADQLESSTLQAHLLFFLQTSQKTGWEVLDGDI